MSYRAERLFWHTHRFELFIAALLIFWLAAILAARRLRLTDFRWTLTGHCAHARICKMLRTRLKYCKTFLIHELHTAIQQLFSGLWTVPVFPKRLSQQKLCPQNLQNVPYLLGIRLTPSFLPVKIRGCFDAH
jgi:hypothetical protein